MENTSVNILVEAKKEYTKQIIQIIKPHLLEGIFSIFNEAKKICAKKNEPKLILVTFQELLSQVTSWNQTLISEETNSIIEASGCDYINDLITAVFVCHTKILSYVRMNETAKKINLKIPSAEVFIHQIYVELSREFWKQPSLLYEEGVSNVEYQRNIALCQSIIELGIENTIRSLLPFKTILQQYLNEESEEQEEIDVKEPTNAAVSKIRAAKHKSKKGVKSGRKKEEGDDEDSDSTSSSLSSASSSSSSSSSTSSSSTEEEVARKSSKKSKAKKMEEIKSVKEESGKKEELLKDASESSQQSGGSIHVTPIVAPIASPSASPIASTTESLFVPEEVVVDTSSSTLGNSPIVSIPATITSSDNVNMHGGEYKSFTGTSSPSSPSSPYSLSMQPMELNLSDLDEVKVDFGLGNDAQSMSNADIRNNVIQEIESFRNNKLSSSPPQQEKLIATTPATASSYSFF